MKGESCAMLSDEVKNKICEKIGKVLREMEDTYLGGEDYEVTVAFPDESWEWNVTGWDKV